MKKSIDINILLAQISKQDFEDYYNLHNYKDTLQHFNLSERAFHKLNAVYKIKKSKEATVNTWKNTINQKQKTCKYSYPTEFELIKYFKDEVHSRHECAQHFNVKLSIIDYLLRFYDIKKTKEENKNTLRRISQEESIKTKRKEAYRKTCLEKYSVENAMKLKNIWEKGISTKIEKYGKDNINNWKKAKNTKIEKYGSWENYVEHQQKVMTETNREKFGVAYVLEDTLKMQKGLIKKYGVVNCQQSAEIRAKTQKTNQERYGGNSPFCSKEVREKFNKVMQEKYAVNWAMQNPDIAKKQKNNIDYQKRSDHMMQTCLERYGVPYFCMTEECRNSSSAISSVNKFFSKILDTYNIEYQTEYTIDRKSYDFKIGDILIEVNPTITHNSTVGYKNMNKPISKDYHEKKTTLALANNYRCINIWDWDNVPKILNSILFNKVEVYARKCKIIEINDKKIINSFLEKNHLQGKCQGVKFACGLLYNDQLIELMTFGKSRYNKNYEWELLRLCSDINYKIIGGSSKLFKYFLKKINPKSVISYCDLSKFSGQVYKNLNFTLLRHNQPSKHWYNIKTKQHITDNLLRQKGFDKLFNTSYGKGSSNEELMLMEGFLEIYDAGQDAYIFVNENTAKLNDPKETN